MQPSQPAPGPDCSSNGLDLGRRMGCGRRHKRWRGSLSSPIVLNFCRNRSYRNTGVRQANLFGERHHRVLDVESSGRPRLCALAPAAAGRVEVMSERSSRHSGHSTRPAPRSGSRSWQAQRAATGPADTVAIRYSLSAQRVNRSGEQIRGAPRGCAPCRGGASREGSRDDRCWVCPQRRNRGSLAGYRRKSGPRRLPRSAWFCRL